MRLEKSFNKTNAKKTARQPGASMNLNLDNLRDIMKIEGRRRDWLAKKCNVSRGHLGHIACGNRSPSVELLVSLANALNCSVDFLLGRTHDPSQKRASGQ